jgi:hypothetical protein
MQFVFGGNTVQRRLHKWIEASSAIGTLGRNDCEHCTATVGVDIRDPVFSQF